MGIVIRGGMNLSLSQPQEWNRRTGLGEEYVCKATGESAYLCKLISCLVSHGQVTCSGFPLQHVVEV